MIAFVMMFGFALTTVHAAGEQTGTITVEHAREGIDYSLYRLFNATTESNATSYTLDKESWVNTALQDSTFKAAFDEVFTLIGDGEDKYVAKKSTSNDDKFKAFYDAVKTYISNHPDSVTVVETKKCNEGEQKVEFSGLSYGYYYVSTSTGSVVTIDTLNGPTATVYDKNEIDTTKTTTVLHPSIGTSVPFEVTVPQTKFGVGTLVVKDVMTDGLTFNNDIKVYSIVENVKQELNNLNNQYYSINYGLDNNGVEESIANDSKLAYLAKEGKVNWNFILTFTPKGLEELSKSNIRIEYSATLNEAAAALDLSTNQMNTVSTQFNESVIDTTDLTVYKPLQFNIYKFTGDKTPSNVDGTETKLKDAEFELFSRATTTSEYGRIEFFEVKENDDVVAYRKATADEISKHQTTTTLKTNADGKIIITGLGDLDNGDYKLSETKAPTGYNKLNSDLIFTIDQDEDESNSETKTVSNKKITLSQNTDTGFFGLNSNNDQINVKNISGALLPSTGGSGTTMMYIAGGALLIGAVVLMITRKRVSE